MLAVGLFNAWMECMLGVVWAYYDYLRLLREYSGGDCIGLIKVNKNNKS